MPLHYQTPFDRMTDPDEDRPSNGQLYACSEAEEDLLHRVSRFEARQKRRRKWWGMAADCCYIAIEAGGFLLACWLMAMGLPLLLILVLSGGQLDMLFVFLGNLFGHFADADPGRKAAFSQDATYCLIGLATLIAGWRLPRFLNAVTETLSRERKVL
jgi:hypothetical protein